MCNTAPAASPSALAAEQGCAQRRGRGLAGKCSPAARTTQSRRAGRLVKKTGAAAAATGRPPRLLLLPSRAAPRLRGALTAYMAVAGVVSRGGVEAWRRFCTALAPNAAGLSN